MYTAFVIFILIMSVILHEVAHGWVASKCGDPTAEAAGRLTLNPIPHIDPFMTVVLPALLWFTTGGKMVFGAAKPVPVSPGYLRKWPRDFILVSLAGVAVNLAIALFLAVLMRVPFLANTAPALYHGAYLNIFLAVFNLVPIPPLDGSRAFQFLLPREMRDSYRKLEPYGFFIIIILFQVPPFRRALGFVTDQLAHILIFWGA